MSTTETTNQTQEQRQPGFFGRLFQKLDNRMKAKAEESSGCCCGGDDTDANAAAEAADKKPGQSSCC